MTRTTPGLALLVAMIVAFARAAIAQDAPPATFAWDDVDPAERRLVERLVASQHWPFRAISLMRLERYTGEGVDTMVRERLDDDAWQVRAFAVRAATRRGLAIPPDTFDKETDARVMRAALHASVPVDAKRVERGARMLLRSRDLDELLLGLELAAASDQPALHAAATKRFRRLVDQVDEPTLVRIGYRLARLLRIDPAPQNMTEWKDWWASGGDAYEFGPGTAGRRGFEDEGMPIIAQLDVGAFSAFIEYLDGLRGQDLELAIVMDATQSMEPMVNEARAGIEQLILFFADLSRSFRLAVIAYRDNDNPPIWEGQPLSDDIRAVRKFLFEVRITGGADLPEAVLDGLAACARLDWKDDATRQIILVGDARPHDEDVYRIGSLLDELVNKDIDVHTVHVPMEMNERYRRALPPAEVESYQARIDDHNTKTVTAFQDIADGGGGDAVTLNDAHELVPAIMHLTIAEAWWGAFDEFYGVYLRMCR